MRRTSAWTRSRLICVAVFLLADLSGCDKKAGLPEASPGMTAEPIGEMLTVEQPQDTGVPAPDASPEPVDAGQDAKAEPDAGEPGVEPDAGEPGVEPIMQLKVNHVEVLKDEVEAVREVRVAAKRASTKAYSMDAQADDMGELVLDRRYARLDSWAQKQGWSLTALPKEAARDPQMQQWWEEWRVLNKRAAVRLEAKQ